MKTEEEARKCWCPFARVLNTAFADDARAHTTDNPDDTAMVLEGNPHNRIFVSGDEDEDSIGSGTRCFASSCMAWRWHSEETAAQFQRQADTGKRHDPIGFCGLAGTPQ